MKPEVDVLSLPLDPSRSTYMNCAAQEKRREEEERASSPVGEIFFGWLAGWLPASRWLRAALAAAFSDSYFELHTRTC